MSNQFKSSEYGVSVNSKSTIVPSDHQQKYRDGETMRFEIPPFMSYIDPRQSYLKLKLSIQNAEATNHIRLKLNKLVGAQGIIDRIRIYDGNSQVQLENIENYAELAHLTNHYTSNESITAKRSLLEGLEETETFSEGQFFNAYPADSGIGVPINASVDMNPNSLEIAMPLHSGVLGGKKLFPVELFDGLRCEIDLNNAGKFLQNFSPCGLATDVGGAPWANGTAIVTAVGSATVALLPNQVGGAGVGVPVGDTDNCNADNLSSMNNLRVGDTLSGITANGAVQVLGVVASFVEVAMAGVFPAPHIEVTLTAPYNPVAAINNLPVWTTGTAPLGNVFVSSSQYNDNIPRVNIENVELIVKQVSPPQSMIDQYAKQIATPQGVSYDIMTYSTYRNNIQASENVSQVQIPSYNSRVKGVLCCPMDNGLPTNLTTNNLKTTLDNIKQYQFYINGQPQPTRAVPTFQYSALLPTISQIALWELEKTLATCKKEVRNLGQPEDNFAIGRALARYGGCYNLKEVGGLSLKQEYTNPTKNKLLLTFVGHLRKLVVNTSGKIVEL